MVGGGSDNAVAVRLILGEAVPSVAGPLLMSGGL
jgi:hypothetical protein